MKEISDCVCSISDSESHCYHNNEVVTKHSGSLPQDNKLQHSTLSSNVNSKDFYAHRSYTPHFNRQEKWIWKSGV